MKLFWGLLFILIVLSIGIQVAIFYEVHPESIGPHLIPLATPASGAFSYLLIPFVALLVGSALLWNNKEKGRLFALFFQFAWLLTPAVSIIRPGHLPHAIRIEQSVQIALFALTIVLTVRPLSMLEMRKAVGISFPLALLYVLVALRF